MIVSKRIYFPKYTVVSLSNNPEYLTKISIGNNQLNLRCGYNLRLKKRWIIITDVQGYVLLNQTFLHLNQACELNFNAEQTDLNYAVMLKRKSYVNMGASIDYLNWANNLELLFIGNSQKEQESYHRNYVNVVVGS